MSILKTIYLQHLNGANANMTLDSSGRVGIGNTSPSFPLHVGGEIFSGRSDSSTEGGQISLGRASDNALHYYIDCYGGSTTPTMRFVDGSIGVTRMSIDSSGYINKPYQPSFSAKATGSGPSASGTILFNEIDNNIGSHYSASTGRFTAPIAGRYLFSHFVLFSVGGTNASLSAQIRKNGAAAVHPYTRSTGADYVSTAGTVILSLSAGDYVTVYVDEGTIYATGAAHNNFSGFLIG